MLLGGVAGTADGGGQTVCSPLYPGLVRIPMSDNAGEGETGGGMARREGAPATPELTSTAGDVRILAVEGFLQHEIRRTGSTHSCQGFKTGVAHVVIVLATSRSISHSPGSKLQAP